MNIYIDNDYKCHATDDGTMREFNVPFFNNKSPIFIEGYRYIPQGETWANTRGIVFQGEMIAPWKNYEALELAQEAYEQAQELFNIIDGTTPIEEEEADDES